MPKPGPARHSINITNRKDRMQPQNTLSCLNDPISEIAQMIQSRQQYLPFVEF
jgi:hypothetical protein